MNKNLVCKFCKQSAWLYLGQGCYFHLHVDKCTLSIDGFYTLKELQSRDWIIPKSGVIKVI